MARNFTRVKKTIPTEDINQALTTKIGRWLSEGASWCKKIHDRSEENQNYVGGSSQWSEGDIMKQELRDRPHMPMNKIIQVINAIANKEIVQRYVPKCYGRSRKDGGYAEAYDEFIRWQRDMSESEHEDSTAFRSMISSGYGVIHKYFDPLEADGHGQIMDEEVPIWWMLWDSRARKQNLVDRRWHMCGKYVSYDEAKEEFSDSSPDAKKLFNQLDSGLSNYDVPNTQTSTGVGAGGRWPWDSVVGGKWYNRADNEIFLIEVEWKDVKTIWKAAVPIHLDEYANLISDPQAQVDLAQFNPQMDAASQDPNQKPSSVITGEQFSQMDEMSAEQIKEEMLQDTKIQMFESNADFTNFANHYQEVTGQPFTDVIKQKKYVYMYAFHTANTVLETGERKTGFTYEFLTGFPLPTRDGTTFFGFVDIAKGPQDWRNTFLSLALTRLAHSPKQTLLIEEDAVENTDELFDQLANPRGAAIVPSGFIKSGKYMTLDPPTFPPMERELIAMADQTITEMAGLSGIDLGQQGDLRRISGTVVQSVKDASNTILALLFDSLRRYRKRTGKLILNFMYEFYTPQQVARIIGEENAEFVQDLENFPDISKFDIKIDEAPTSVTDKMEFFDFLTRTNTLDKWVSEDRIPFDMVMDWNPWLSESDKLKLKDYNDQKDQTKQQMQQAQQQAQDAQQKMQQAQTDLKTILAVIQSAPNGQDLMNKFMATQQLKTGSGPVDPDADSGQDEQQQGGQQNEQQGGSQGNTQQDNGASGQQTAG